MEDGELGTKLLTSTVGGCAVNTTRSANFYLQAMGKSKCSADFDERVMTIGAIGSDEQGKKVRTQLNSESVPYSVFQAEETMTGSCAVTVN
jgi:sugar/nucleoside kinase (ribokinase family)